MNPSWSHASQRVLRLVPFYEKPITNGSVARAEKLRKMEKSDVDSGSRQTLLFLQLFKLAMVFGLSQRERMSKQRTVFEFLFKP
jgi:hypothetical protein